MRYLTHTLLLPSIILATLAASSGHAETIKIPLGQQSSGQQIDRPTLGMHQNVVEKQFGEPTSWQEPKGTPPISRWEYEHFVVYFESSYVIHSVVKHRPAQNPATSQ